MADREGLIRRRPTAYGVRFVDLETGEEVTEEEAVNRYLHLLPGDRMPIPEELRAILKDTPTQLIEVGRLRDVAVAVSREMEARRGPERISAVARCAADLTGRIRSIRAANSVAAQRVDRSYANRLIGASTGKIPSDSDIRESYASVLGRQDELATLTLLETQGDFALPEGELQPWQRWAVGLHLEDSLEKLQIFDHIAAQMALFKAIVNGKLEHKRMTFDASEGFRFVSEFGGEVLIAPDQLLSGEQHLVVMTYRLLFETGQGELVLIDEPEISLHVAWQRKFLDDLQQIAQLQRLRFIVATHSPQIVGRWTDRLVSLGSVE